MLVPRDGAERHCAQACHSINQYIHLNHASWVHFANDVLGFTTKPDDIIFIRGTIKTSAWIVAAVFENKERGHQISLQAQAGSLAEAGFHLSSSFASISSIEHRSGPRRTRDGLLIPGNTPYISPNTPIEDVTRKLMASTDTLVPGRKRDQPVFIGYYKLKSRKLWRGKKLVANAGSHELPPGEDPSQSSDVAIADQDEDVQVEMHPPPSQVRATALCMKDQVDILLAVTFGCRRGARLYIPGEQPVPSIRVYTEELDSARMQRQPSSATETSANFLIT